MNQVQVIQTKIKRCDDAIIHYTEQLEATGEKLVSLKNERVDLQAQLTAAINEQPDERKTNREPDGDLLYA